MPVARLRAALTPQGAAVPPRGSIHQSHRTGCEHHQQLQRGCEHEYEEGLAVALSHAGGRVRTVVVEAWREEGGKPAKEYIEYTHN